MSPRRTYPCPCCEGSEAVFDHICRLQSHMSTAHPGQRLRVCRYMGCAFYSTSREPLAAHIAAHAAATAATQVQCVRCLRECPDRESYLRHLVETHGRAARLVPLPKRVASTAAAAAAKENRDPHPTQRWVWIGTIPVKRGDGLRLRLEHAAAL